MLNYTIKGQGQPIVLIHGLFGSLENLGVIARQLEDEFQVFSIDLPDHGQSPRTDTFSFKNYADMVVKTMRSYGLEKAHLLGHSLGGKVAMHIALTQPELVDKLVVADIAPVSYAPRHQNVFAALTSFEPKDIRSRQEADKLMSAHIDELGVRQFLLKSLYKNQHGNFEWRFNLPLLLRDYEHLSQGIDAEQAHLGDVLFIKGGDSDYITMDHQTKIKRLFPNANAKIMAGAGHWLHAQKPFVFAGIVAKFLK